MLHAARDDHRRCRRLSRAALTAVVTSTATLALAAPGAHAAGATRLPLVGPAADMSCDNLIPFDQPTENGPGFVIFNSRNGVVTALVVLRGAQPNTAYPVRLLQGARDDCFEVGGTLETNRKGNGTLRLTEPDRGRFAQVVVDTEELFGLPTYRATRRFRTDA